MVAVDCLVEARAMVGESPVWSVAEQRLYWVDIVGMAVHRTDLAGNDEVWTFDEPVGCLALRKQGGLLLALASGFYTWDPANGTLKHLHDPEPERPDNRFNDGACDRQGRLWAGTMWREGTTPGPGGALYRLEANGASWRFADGYWISNGLAFSPDGRTMYHSDSYPEVQTIWAYDYDPDEGVPGNKRVFATTFELAGRPDGGTVDADGCYWMAGVSGWQLVRFTPAGEVDRIIDMPVEKPTKIAFCGPRLDTMLVTSIGNPAGLTEGTHQPQAGGLFMVQAGVPGLPEPLFAG